MGFRVTQLPLEHGMNLNPRNKNIDILLHSASYFGKPETAGLFFDHGAEAHTEDNDGEKPLHRVLGRNTNLKNTKLALYSYY
jgi:ankyrin repeat protein